jgi:hypothetical protein
VEPERAYLFLAVAQEPGHSVFCCGWYCNWKISPLGLLLCSVLPWSAAANDAPGVVKLQENTLLVVFLDIPYDCLFCFFFLRVSAVPCSVFGPYLYIRNPETRTSRFLQITAFPHCCGVMLSALEY